MPFRPVEQDQSVFRRPRQRGASDRYKRLRVEALRRIHGHMVDKTLNCPGHYSRSDGEEGALNTLLLFAAPVFASLRPAGTSE